MDYSSTKHTLTLMWLITALIIIISLLISVDAFGRSEDFYEGLSRQDREYARSMERKYLRRGHEAIRYKGDAEIKEDEYIRGDVIILDGTLEVNGEVEGTVLALFGDVVLGDDAHVHGDVIAVEGDVIRDEDAEVEGDIVETQSRSGRKRTVIYRGRKKSDEETYVESKKRKKEKRKVRTHHDPIWANYNRVDGLALGLQLPTQEWWCERNHSFALTGKGGYAFAGKRWQWQLGMQRWIGSEYRLSLGAEIHDLTDTQDRWIIGDTENSLAAAIIKEDFQDFYRREGYSFFASQNLGKKVKLSAAYNNDRFRNLEQRAKWSLFGGKKRFPANPPALPVGLSYYYGLDNEPYLDIESVSATLTIDSRDDRERTTNGWYVTAIAERAGHELESDLEFERFIVDIRRYQPLGWDENLNIRLRAGTATGTLPPMYWFDLGGISTLRGYGYKELTGDRMVLGNIEYRLNTSRADWFILDSFDIILFGDAGLAWFANEDLPDKFESWPLDPEYVEMANHTYPRDTFEELTWDRLKTDIGIALASHDDNFRINFAKRMDRNFGDDDIVITFRIAQPF